MANDAFFTATSTWQFVQVAAADITNGTFSIFLNRPGKVFLFKTDTLPAQTVTGTSFLGNRGDFSKFALGATDKLAIRSTADSTDVGVIPA